MPPAPWRRVLLFAAAVALLRLGWVLLAYYGRGSYQRHHLESAWFLFSAAALVTVAATRNNSLTENRARYLLPDTLCWVLVGAAGLALYAPALSLGLLSDDYFFVASPIVIESWQFFRPLPLALWKMVFPVAGAAGLHALNIAIHCLNACLLYALMSRAKSETAPVARLLGALVFLTFPANVEVIAWNSGIFDLLLVTAALVYCLVLQSESRWRLPYAIAVVAAALCIKETAVILPLLGFLASPPTRDNIRTGALSLAICGAYVVTRLVSGVQAPGGIDSGYMLKEMVSRPFATFGLPWTTTELATQPLLLGIGTQATLLIALAAALFGGRAEYRGLRFLVWPLLAVAPLGSYLYIGPNLEGSRYLYLPLVGWAVFLALSVDRIGLPFLRNCALVALCVLVGAYAVGVRRHLETWLAAADLRDDVLARSVLSYNAASCSKAHFDGVPASVGGAYVFLNGFAEAQSGLGLVITRNAEDAVPTCRFIWTDGAFKRTP